MGTDEQRGLGRAHKRIKTQVIAQWVLRNGWVCPGWERPRHPVAPGKLTGDHIIPRSKRPDLANDPSNYGVLCGPCNSKKGSKTDGRFDAGASPEAP